MINVWYLLTERWGGEVASTENEHGIAQTLDVQVWMHVSSRIVAFLQHVFQCRLFCQDILVIWISLVECLQQFLYGKRWQDDSKDVAALVVAVVTPTALQFSHRWF
jgi:hypothetical protein